MQRGLQRSLGIPLNLPLGKSVVKLLGFLDFKANLVMPNFNLSHSGLK